MLETGLGVPLLRIKRETGSVAPFMSEGVIARIDIGSPGLQVLAADDVDHASYGIGAIEGRRSTLHNLDTSYMVEVQSVVIDIVHRLACHTLAIDKEEHGIATKTTHV